MADAPQVNPPSPSANPAKDQATVELQKTVNTLVFNEQVFLLDYMNLLPGHFKNPRNPVTQVVNLTSGKNSPVINDFLVKADSVFQFIQAVTTEEYAQLVPKIQLFVVQGEKQIPLPLITPTNLGASGGGAAGYYSGNTAGLKSITMSVDGATNPISGKIFNIEISLVFDSINTFFGGIPGMSLSYADVFRSYPGHDTRIKACIGYDSANAAIREKYSLETLTYTAYLQFITSDIQIEENLKTSVKARFQGFQESVIADRELFNFIEIDLKKAKENVAAQTKAYEESLAGSKKKITSQIAEYNKLERFVQGVEASTVPAIESAMMPAADSQSAFNRAMAKKLRTSKNSETLTAAAQLATLGYGLHKSSIGDRGYYLRANDEKGSSYNKAIDEYMGTDDAEKPDFRQILLEDVQKKIKPLQQSAKEMDSLVANFKKNQAVDLNSLRIGQINNILNTAIYIKPMFNSISIDEQQLKNYIEGATSLKGQKNYFNSFTAPTAKNTSSANVATVVADQKRTIEAKGAHVEGNQTSEKVFARKARAERKKVEDIQKKIDAGKGKGLGMSHIDKMDRERSAKKYEDKAKAKREEVTADQKKLASAITGLDALKTHIFTQKTMEYVLFGDLLSAVMQYLLANKPNGQVTLNKMRFFMTQINLINPFAGSTSQTVNMYNIPISVNQLQKFFSDKLYGTFAETMSMFELFRGLIDLIALTQKRRSRFQGVSSAVNNNYSVQFIPYAVEKRGPVGYIISTKADSSAGVFNGIIFFARESNIDLGSLGGSYANNVQGGVPHFFLGGQALGVVKAIKISEKQAKGFKKAVWEKNQTNNTGGDSSASNTIPAIFDVTVTTLGMPYFQMGAFFYLDTPTIRMSASASKWFLLSGYYQIVELSHEYAAGGLFTSTIKGILQVAKSQMPPTTQEMLSAAESGDVGTAAVIALVNPVVAAKMASKGYSALKSAAGRALTGKKPW